MNVTALSTRKEFPARDLDLMRMSVAKDCNPTEFNQFIHIANQVGLDPLRKQIYAFVFNKDKPEKRQLTIVTGIDGFRSVARRTGDFRPADEVPKFTFDAELEDENTNPLGIVDCTVTTYFYSHGDWHPVPHRVDWAAYAPLKEIWENNRPTGKFKLDVNKKRWRIDPKGMLAKCAEAGSIRKAFPDDFSSIYEHNEIDQMQTVDLAPSEYAEQYAKERRQEMINGKGTLLFDFMDDEGLHPVEVGKLADRIVSFVNEQAEPDAIDYWKDRNTHSLKAFWAQSPSDALEVKKVIESKIKELSK